MKTELHSNMKTWYVYKRISLMFVNTEVVTSPDIMLLDSTNKLCSEGGAGNL
jgi:hypothetical protein